VSIGLTLGLHLGKTGTGGAGASEPLLDPTTLTWALLLDGASLGADAAAIAQWDDTSGNTRHATQATAGKRPVVEVNAEINGEKWAAFTAASLHALTTAAITPSPASNKATIYIVAKNTADPGILFELTSNYGSNNGSMLIDVESATLAAASRATSTNQQYHGDTAGTGWRLYAARIDHDIRKMRSMPLLDGRARATTIVANANPTATTNFGAHAAFIGARNQTSFYINGGIAWLGLAYALHYPDTVRQMVRYFNDRYGLGATVPVGVLCFDGDSNTDANDVAVTTKPWGARILDTLTDPYDAMNFGVAGIGFGTTGQAGSMAADAATQVDPYVNPDTPGSNVLVVMNGINDLYTPTAGALAWNNTTKENTILRIQDYMTARKTAGWKTVLFTLLPNDNAGWNAAAQDDYMAVERPFVNDWILNDAVSEGYCDAVVDLTANANLEDETNTTYYHTDKAHLVAAGHQEVADELEPVLATLGVT
jgi:lysophospholipase L1-like esterase